MTGMDGPVAVGDVYLWEPYLPHARCLVRVTEVKEDADGEVWVCTIGWDLSDGKFPPIRPDQPLWNELSRVREACVRLPIPGRDLTPAEMKRCQEALAAVAQLEVQP